MKQRDLLTQLMARRVRTSGRHRPFVSVVTPTWNRRAFLPWLLYMFQYQDYPADRRELIVLDDSEQSNADLIAAQARYATHPEYIRYYHVDERMTLGQKRNRLNALARGEYIICMDDDDYYPPDRLSYTIDEMLRHNALFAGCDTIPVWYSHINRIFKTAAFGPRHALNGTFACHRRFLKKHRYDDDAILGEEKGFLDNFTVPVHQLSPERTILCISHSSNTFDKNFIMDSCEPSAGTLSDFVADNHLRKHYRRLHQAPVKSRINWPFFQRILVNAQSRDENHHQAWLRTLYAQGVTPDRVVIIAPESPTEPPARSHLRAARLAESEGWANYLLLDDRTLFVRQEKTVASLNQLLSALSHLRWDVALLGCELQSGHLIKALPSAVKVTQMRQPVACAVNQPAYAAFIAMLEATQFCSEHEAEQQWATLSAAGRWFALYPGYVWRDVDEQGHALTPCFFRKLNTLSTGAVSAEEPQ